MEWEREQERYSKIKGNKNVKQNKNEKKRKNVFIQIFMCGLVLKVFSEKAMVQSKFISSFQCE